MIRISAAAFLMAATAACAPPAAETTTQTTSTASTETAAAAPGCAVDAPARTLQFAGQPYQIEAHAEGADCPSAVATLRIKAPNGSTAFETSYPINQVPLAFNPNGAAIARLSTELEAWTQNVAEQPTADSLPAWPAGAAKPPHFTPALAREAYELARTAKRPIFCFPDGGESNACVAIDTGAQTAMLLGSRTPERP